MTLNFGGIQSLFKSSKTSNEGLNTTQIKEGSFDWSVHGTHFIPRSVVDDSLRAAYYHSYGIETAGEGDIKGICSVNIPNNAIIVSAAVFGGDRDDTWTLKRINLKTAALKTLTSGTFNIYSKSISYAQIDNTKYGYFMETGAVADDITGARITYNVLA